jgi:sugar phosphate permease
VFAAWTAGMVAGALRVAPRVSALAAGGLAALALQGAGMAAAACWPVLLWVVAGYLAGGVGHGVKNVLLRTLIQSRVDPAAHGRAFAAYNAARNTAELGALALGGVALGLFGAQTALLLAGLGPVAAGLAGLALLRSRPATGARRGKRIASADGRTRSPGRQAAVPALPRATFAAGVPGVGAGGAGGGDRAGHRDGGGG